jgi:hypothetical protein
LVGYEGLKHLQVVTDCNDTNNGTLSCTSITEDSTNQATTGKVSMDSSKPQVIAGMVYSEQLASIFGVPKTQSAQLTPPLLGAGLDIKAGNRGGNMKAELEQAPLEDETASSRGSSTSWYKIIN